MISREYVEDGGPLKASKMSRCHFSYVVQNSCHAMSTCGDSGDQEDPME